MRRMRAGWDYTTVQAFVQQAICCQKPPDPPGCAQLMILASPRRFFPGYRFRNQ